MRAAVLEGVQAGVHAVVQALVMLALPVPLCQINQPHLEKKRGKVVADKVFVRDFYVFLQTVSVHRKSCRQYDRDGWFMLL